MATCSIAAGAGEVYKSLQEMVGSGDRNGIEVGQVGCVGLCYLEPLLQVFCDGQKPVTYSGVDAEKAKVIFERHALGGEIQQQWVVPDDILPTPDGKTIQRRIALRHCGLIDPEQVKEYIAVGGYRALAQVLTTMSPEQVIDIVARSGLRGRGGAGFPTGRKWEFTRKAEGDVKYVICNADEGDPGAFMDRSALEGDPHSVLEAMAIGGFAIGSNQGYIYIRAEYPLAIKRLKIAIAQAREMGLLGKNILGSGFDFDIDLRLGAGAFVCGEETALIQSIEGKRGMPRPRPPFPAVSGLWGKPTLINNVETWANIPAIITNGPEWFASIGTETSKGTKVFALAGKVNNTGLVEVPMGTTLRQIIEEIGGGIKGGKKFKAAQTGGPAGGCLPASMLDTPVDYESLTRAGSIMGSGGLIVMDEDTCMVDVARFFLEFTQDESCGKCVPCREGTKRMLEILTRITQGQGQPGDIEKLERLGRTIKRASLCGLGQAAPNPVLSTIANFRDEYEVHIYEKRCPAHVCSGLLTYSILEDKCVGCGLCRRNCPVQAISGSPRQPHVIDVERCIKCGECLRRCKFGAVQLV
ncbi:MAG: NADH-quinone oxidoreductase subunit NuoF [Armatimonadota bacterium]